MSLPQEEPRNEMPGYERFMKNQYLQNKRKEGKRTHIYTGPPPGIDRDGRSIGSPRPTYGGQGGGGYGVSQQMGPESLRNRRPGGVPKNSDRVANQMNKYGSGSHPAGGGLYGYPQSEVPKKSDRVANQMNEYGSGYSPASPAGPMSPIEDGRHYEPEPNFDEHYDPKPNFDEHYEREPIEQIGVGPNGSTSPIEDGRSDDPYGRSYPQKGGGQYAAGNRPSQTPARGGQGYVPRKSSYKSRSNSKQRMAGEVFN